jgi:NAD(P)-dependent dehydrogenase (short-subunit alcohol dehydrogenase family)
LTSTLALEEPDVHFVAIRPGVVDTAMQNEIREKGPVSIALLPARPNLACNTNCDCPFGLGADAMAPEHYKRFTQLHTTSKLLAPELPGSVMASLAVKGATMHLSGGFYSWDDAALQPYKVDST